LVLKSAGAVPAAVAQATVFFSSSLNARSRSLPLIPALIDPYFLALAENAACQAFGANSARFINLCISRARANGHF
jgi:hypothetical protein